MYIYIHIHIHANANTTSIHTHASAQSSSSCTKLLKLLQWPTPPTSGQKTRMACMLIILRECAILYPNVDCVLLSYHCHTFCHTVVIPWASIWSLGRFCQFCLAVLSTNLPRRMCQANLPHVVIPVVIPLLSYLVVIPVVNRCCHTRVYVRRPPIQIGTRPYTHMCIYMYDYCM